jgi:hypothetical protein
MAKPIDETTIKILKEYGQDPKQALWDCHGTWVMYHKHVERIAALAGIRFDAPQIIEARSADKIAVVCVVGHMGDRQEWSFGEAAPSNNKNSYPWAMAEKRAKDRVALKLVGLAGFVYSEEEADDFKQRPKDEPKNVADEWMGYAERVQNGVRSAADPKDLTEMWKAEASDLAVLKLEAPETYQGLVDAFSARKQQLTGKAA